MKSQSCRPDISEMPPYRLGRHWNTIQAYLIPGLEDDIGELSEELKKFMGICELLIDEKMFAKYRWRGNGRPPSSRISLFKAYILKAMRNYPYTKTLIAAVRESPTVRRLCGWESVADIPDKSQFSRAFKAFAKDDVGSKALAACLAENLERNGVMHGSHDSSEIEAREKGVTRRRDALSEINVTDVVEHLGVSRRLADRRFREIEKSSIMETIISIRLNEVKSRLASTRLPIGLITQACGFKNDNYAKNLFRRRFGMSMREWRKHVIHERE